MKSTVRTHRKIAAAFTGAVVAALAVGGVGPAATAAHFQSTQAHTPVPAGYKILTAPFEAGAGNVVEGSVTCPLTTTGVQLRPQSGGVIISSTSLAANINSMYPSANGWIVWVNNASSATTRFDVWAVCAKPKTAYTQTATAALSNPAGTQSHGTAFCPSGTKILGGGASSPNLDVNQNINDSMPFHRGSTYGWTVYMNNAGSANETFSVWAVCSAYSVSHAGYTIVEGATTTDPGGTQTGSHATCPPGDSPLGGGETNSSVSTLASLNADWPLAGSISWAAFENNGNSSPDTQNAWVICAS
jgi:hypothetical protein